jgi:hypothetical protein
LLPGPNLDRDLPLDELCLEKATVREVFEANLPDHWRNLNHGAESGFIGDSEDMNIYKIAMR